MLLLHTWSFTPWPAHSLCTPGHLYLALYILCAFLLIHTLFRMLPLHSCFPLHALCHSSSSTPCYAFFVHTCTPTSCFAHIPHAHLLIHTLPCTLLVHIWSHPWLCMLLCTTAFLCMFLLNPLSPTPCSAHFLCTFAHPHLALHVACAHICLHSWLCTLLVHTLLLCTPAFLCILHVHPLSHTPCSESSLCTPALLCPHVMPTMPCTPPVPDTARP